MCVFVCVCGVHIESAILSSDFFVGIFRLYCALQCK